jgi:phosphoglycerate dehydrogenase-like enzyme
MNIGLFEVERWEKGKFDELSKEHDLETLLADHILLRLRNVMVTPHSAFNTREAVTRILDTTKENIDAYIKGEPQNVVDDIHSFAGG